MLFMHEPYISLFKDIKLLQMYLLFEKKIVCLLCGIEFCSKFWLTLFKVPNTAVLAQCGKEADTTR